MYQKTIISPFKYKIFMDYVLLDEKFARTAYPSIDALKVGMQFQIPESL